MATSSIQRTSASGSTAVFSVPFPYLDKTHVQVRVAGVLKAAGTDYTWPTSSTIQLTAGNPAAGTVVERRRVTPPEPLVTFQPGNLDSGDLNVAELQAVYLAQEANDTATDFVDSAWTTANNGAGGNVTVGSDDTVPKWENGALVPGPTVTDIESAQANAEQVAADMATVSGYKDAAQASADAAAAALASLGSVMRLAGPWDASSGSFPTGTIAKGSAYAVSTAGTVDGVSFSSSPADMLVALVDNPSATTYAANWLKFDFSDLVASVAGLTGSISKAGLTAAVKGTDGNSLAAGDDSRITGALPKAGGTMTGDLTLKGAPTADLMAATKLYADRRGAPDAVLEDQKAAATAAGTFTSGAWQTRDLNTKVRDPNAYITLSSNQFTPTVDGWVEWSAPGYKVDRHATRLYNVTDGVEVAAGTAEWSPNGTSITTHSNGGAPVVGGKTYRVEHQCNTTVATNGLGNSASYPAVSVYTRLLFWRS